MDNFWQQYWWTVVIGILAVLLLIYIIYRIYQIFHIDYYWERNLHFPQWSNEGIITRDNYFLHTEFKFVDNSKYIIIGVHGMGASLTDFKTSTKYFTKNCISFLSFDQRGFGENEKWKYHTLGTTINDIKDIISVLNERYPDKKIILMGESLGSALTALAAKKLTKMIDGAILTNFVTKKQVLKLKPSLVCQSLWGFLFHKHHNLPITFEMEEISTNPKYIKNGKMRAMTNMKFTLLFSLQAQKLSKNVPKNLNSAKCPVLIVQSGKDAFADFNKIKINNKHWRDGITYNFYENGKHAILNESNIIEILDDVKKWIDSSNV
ncbi:alpha/beta hydrolase [Spiroplasma endosymbiont of Virgichneumon dumeticola]|uniref:alpha/beta hydrolase n=1 Tax=Spiroplasma endosymbiont of Virgichneumon dumeticola TaxID=3139323 RepID=UPI0035C8C999